MGTLVSVIIPMYNAAQFVLDAVNSTLNQSYSDIEVIVIDDGSTDNSAELLKTIDDRRFRLIQQTNQGACAARNNGLRHANGEYVKFLDADDFLYHDAIALQMNHQHELKQNEIVFGDFDFVDEHGNVFYMNKFDNDQFLRSNQDEWIYQNWEILISCPLHKKETLIKNGGFDESLPWGQESFMHLALSFADTKFVYRPDRIFAYRSHQSLDRISVNRMSKSPKIETVIYRQNRILSMAFEKYGTQPSPFSTLVSQHYFDTALQLYLHKQDEQGDECLKLSLTTPQLNSPTYKKKKLLGKAFIIIGKCIGYGREARIINSILSTFHKKDKNNSKKLNKVLGSEN